MMRLYNKKVSAICLGFAMLLSSGSQALAWESSKVYYGPQGTLQYGMDANQNRIVDFSYAGYHNGEKNIPNSAAISAVQAVSPIAGDNTAHIQQAIDTVSGWTPDSNGIRGVVRLAAGEYRIDGTLRIAASGVILVGAGSGDDATSNTILRRPLGSVPNTTTVLIVGGNLSSQWSGGDTPGNRMSVTDTVYVGARSLTLAGTTGLSVGDNIVIKHPATQAWLDSVDGGGTYNDPDWAVNSQPLIFNRYITAISGNTITIDAPVTNTLDASLSESYVYKYDRAGLVTEVGVESLQITIDTASATSETHADSALVFNTVEDGWVDRVKVQHFVTRGISLQSTTRVTVQNSQSVSPHSRIEGGRRYNFALAYAQLNLFLNNFADYSRHAYIGNGGTWDSGNVFVDNTADRSHDSSELHRQWGHGFLYENHKETNVRSTNLRLLGLYNRGNYGTSHGWAAANSVLWNCNVGSGKAVVEHPPTAENYAIGCKGNISGVGPFSALVPTTPGFIEGTGQTQLSIPSLYRAQLAERLNYTYPAVMDAYVRAGTYANMNFGSEDGMVISNASTNYDRISYIKVDFSAYNRSTIGKAILNFHVVSDLPAQTVTFQGLTDDAWSEGTITWNTVPSATGATSLGTAKLASPGWYSLDVTDYVKSQSDKVVTFRLYEATGSSQHTRISSKESTAYKGPFLIVTPQ